MKSYLLLIEINREAELSVGALGRVRFRKGTYIYVGSARRGMFKRLERHFSKNKRVFWHIDYLTAIFRPKIALLVSWDEPVLVDMLAERYEFIRGFGSSDDRKAPSHLFYSDEPLDSTLVKLVNLLWGSV